MINRTQSRLIAQEQRNLASRGKRQASAPQNRQSLSAPAKPKR